MQIYITFLDAGTSKKHCHTAGSMNFSPHFYPFDREKTHNKIKNIFYQFLRTKPNFLRSYFPLHSTSLVGKIDIRFLPDLIVAVTVSPSTGQNVYSRYCHCHCHIPTHMYFKVQFVWRRWICEITDNLFLIA